MSNWLTYSPISGHGKGTITITADTLPELEERTATIIASNSQYNVSDSVLIKQLKENPTLSTPLTFKIISGGTIYWDSTDEDIVKTISYSKNDGNWVEITSSTAGTPINVSTGDVVKFKGNNSSYASSLNSSNRFVIYDSGALFNVEGNIMSLVDSDGFSTAETLTDLYTFVRLFVNCKGLVSAKNLILPATTLADWCYSFMFEGCTSLTTAPSILPATTLAPYCYRMMFEGCKSLTTAPALPATTLSDGCYNGMFGGCTSLTQAPVLPATTLSDGCYYGMFRNCASLTTVPSNLLPATTLAGECYSNMFDGCTSLTTAPALPATTLTSECYRDMFGGCTSLTTAPELPATDLFYKCYSSMFAGCTSLATAPALPATTLALDCYNSMFVGCHSLTTAPELPATKLLEHCYDEMFRNCTSLNYIKCLATDISTTYGCTNNWVWGVASTGTFVKASSMTSWTTGDDGIPTRWTVRNA